MQAKDLAPKEEAISEHKPETLLSSLSQDSKRKTVQTNQNVKDDVFFREGLQCFRKTMHLLQHLHFSIFYRDKMLVSNCTMAHIYGWKRKPIF